jgi:hypothetical protein
MYAMLALANLATNGKISCTSTEEWMGTLKLINYFSKIISHQYCRGYPSTDWTNNSNRENSSSTTQSHARRCEQGSRPHYQSLLARK